MKISAGKMPGLPGVRITNLNGGIRKNTPASEKAKSIKNYDDISFHRDNAVPEEKFLNDLKNRISSEVRTCAPSYKLNGLKDQIALGEYNIGADEIIKRILLNS